MPYTITHDDQESMPNRLWESADYRKNIFGFKKVSKYNVNAFFFQLVATGILEFKWINANKNVVCCFGEDNNDRIKYKIPTYWKGICFRTAGRGVQEIHLGPHISYPWTRDTA